MLQQRRGRRVEHNGDIGMKLEDGLECLPAGLERLERPDEGIVTLREGKYHQIKRMLEERGKPVVYLKRLTMGPLALDPSLEKGQWRPLSAEEVQALREHASCAGRKETP